MAAPGARIESLVPPASPARRKGRQLGDFLMRPPSSVSRLQKMKIRFAVGPHAGFLAGAEIVAFAKSLEHAGFDVVWLSDLPVGARRGEVLEKVLGLLRSWWAGETADHHSECRTYDQLGTGRSPNPGPSRCGSAVAGPRRLTRRTNRRWVAGRSADPAGGRSRPRADPGGGSRRARSRPRALRNEHPLRLRQPQARASGPARRPPSQRRSPRLRPGRADGPAGVHRGLRRGWPVEARRPPAGRISDRPWGVLVAAVGENPMATVTGGYLRRSRGVVHVAESFRSGSSGPSSAVRHRCCPRLRRRPGRRRLRFGLAGARLPLFDETAEKWCRSDPRFRAGCPVSGLFPGV
jgi:hypothetical protein